MPCKSKTHHFRQLIEFVLEICGCGPSGMDALRVRFSWHIQLTLNVLATLLIPKCCMRFTDAVLRPRKLVMNDLLTTRSKDKDTIEFGGAGDQSLSDHFEIRKRHNIDASSNETSCGEYAEEEHLLVFMERGPSAVQVFTDFELFQTLNRSVVMDCGVVFETRHSFLMI